MQEKKQLLTKLISKVDQDPYDPKAYYELGCFLVTLKNYPAAEELFKRALNAFEKQPKKQDLLRYGLGNVYYASELYQEALHEFNKIKDQKLMGKAYLMIAQTYYAKQDYRHALAYALSAKKDIAAKRLIGDCFLALGEFMQAKKWYQEVLKACPDDLSTNFNLGICQVTLGNDGQKYFLKVKQKDVAYYEKMQARLADIQSFLNHK